MVRCSHKVVLGSLFSLLLIACGQDSVDNNASSSGDMSADSAPDAPDADTMADDMGAAGDMSGEDIDLPSNNEYIKSVRFVRAFKDCATPECKQDVEFAVGSGMLSRFEYEMRIDRVWLEDLERENLREMVLAEPFIEAVKSEDFGCTEGTRGDFNVILILNVDDSPGLKTIDVSDCHGTDMIEELPDPFIDFAIKIERKYD